MLAALAITLIILWFLGYVRIDGLNLPDTTMFSLNGFPVTLWDILILVIVSWAIGILPTPFREIAGVILILWVLAVLGIVALAGINLASIFVVVMIVGLLISLFSSYGVNRPRDTV